MHAREDYNGRIVDLEKKIPEDEPVFLLRAQDKVAPMVVELWAACAEAAGADVEIVRLSRLQAVRMRAWQVDHTSKVADL